MSHINSFTAIDFETANHDGHSICQVGLVRVEEGVIKDQIEMLVKPPGNEYHFIHTKIHGINSRATANAPTFNKVWSSIVPFIRNQNVVAHNSAFDFSALRKTLGYYLIPVPQFRGHCTMKLFGGSLDFLCAKHNIPLNHHNALSDALGCARLFLIHQKGIIASSLQSKA